MEKKKQRTSQIHTSLSKYTKKNSFFIKGEYEIISKSAYYLIWVTKKAHHLILIWFLLLDVLQLLLVTKSNPNIWNSSMDILYIVNQVVNKLNILIVLIHYYKLDSHFHVTFSLFILFYFILFIYFIWRKKCLEAWIQIEPQQ